MINISNYVAYHVHSDYSLLDSCTQFQDYVDYAVKLGQKAICITEHGKPLGWVSKKMYCDKMGIKYIHGVECYLTETLSNKIRDNYHTILIAKNYNGVLEINKAISKSCDAFDKSKDNTHFYYTNRITFDEFLQLSDNVIKISACLASPLNKLPISHPRYFELLPHYDYLEIQPHNIEEQKIYNIHLAELSQKYHKPLIAGTDAHSLNSYKAECRKILLKAKHKSYGDEDKLDLTYKTYEELVNAFKQQDAIPKDIYMQAIENTNVMANSVETFNLDMSLKYPILYGTRENDRIKFKETIDTKFEDKVRKGIIPKEQIQAYITALQEEQRVFSKIEMDGFMLSMSELISWCKDNNIPVGNARGSVGGSRVAYVTDIIDLNPETWNTVFSRFCNEDRKEVGDIDVDVIASDRPKIFEYIVNRFGTAKTARVPAFGTLASKGTIDEIGRALKIYWDEENLVDITPLKERLSTLRVNCEGSYYFNSDNKLIYPKDDDERQTEIDKCIIEIENIKSKNKIKSNENPYSLDKIDKIKKEFESDEKKTREKYPDIFYYYDGLLGTKVSQSVHPAGMVISPITLANHYGVFNKDGDNCLMIDMEEVHEIGLVKYDFLILSNIQIIRDTYNLIGKPYPKSHEIDWDDQKVWEDMLKSPVGIFQMEGEYAHSLLRQYEPHSIFDMSLVTAAIRPSGASYRNKLIQHIPYKNPSPLIDDLLADNNGYLIYQEDTIKFLQQICGFSGSHADNVRRAIGRKIYELVQEEIPKILEGYCSKSSQPRKIAEQEAKAFLQIIEDSADYQFGYNHSIAYCLIGYLCAYLRYYYPYEFITAYLNNAANEDDIKNGTTLAQEYNIKIVPPQYGESKDQYIFNKEKKIIAKGVASIKYLNNAVANELYDLSKFHHNTFVELLMDTEKKTSINSRQLDILIKIDYFKKFGNIPELSRIVSVFEFLKQGTAKTIKKDIAKDWYLLEILKKYSTDKNANGKESASYTINSETMLDIKKEIKSTQKIINKYKKNNQEIPKDLIDTIENLDVKLAQEFYKTMLSFLIECEKYIKSLKLEDIQLKIKMQNQLELLGYIDLTTNKEEDRKKLIITNVIPLKSKDTGVPWGYAVFTRSIGSGKSARLTVRAKTFDLDPINKMDIVYAKSVTKNRSGYWYLIDYYKIYE